LSGGETPEGQIQIRERLKEPEARIQYRQASVVTQVQKKEERPPKKERKREVDGDIFIATSHRARRSYRENSTP